MAETVPSKRPRIYIVDTVRGLAIVSMIFYHACYDAVVFFNISLPWYFSQGGFIWQQTILWTFVIVSGCSAHFSRSSVRRGLIVFGAGMLVTLVTYIATPDEAIYFGVLHFFGLAMIVFGLLKAAWTRISPIAGLCMALLLFVITYSLPDGYLGVLGWELLPLPEIPYSTKFLFWLGFPNITFVSADYVPLLPWFFLYLGGYYLWSILKKSHFIEAWGWFRLPGIDWLGRHSLVIYLLHQPLLMGIFMLLTIGA